MLRLDDVSWKESATGVGCTDAVAQIHALPMPAGIEQKTDEYSLTIEYN